MNLFTLIMLVSGLGQTAAQTSPVPTLASIRTRLTSYERKATETGRPDTAELFSIAGDVIKQARHSPVVALWTAGCASTAIPDDDRCSERLWAVLKQTAERITVRAEAASALIARGDQTAAATLAGLLKVAPSSTLVQLLPVIEKMPARDAVPLLARLSGSSSPDHQAKACEALSAFEVPESHATLTKIVDGNPPGTPPWLYCMIARARLHESMPPGAVAGYGDTLKGGGQLFAARVLHEQGDDSVLQLLVDLTHRGSATDRLTAADLLIDAKPDAAVPVIEAAETNPDPAIRATALDCERRLKRDPSKTVRSMLADSAGTVRIRAAETVIEWAQRSQNR